MTEPEGPAPRQEALQRIDKGYSRVFTTEPTVRRHLRDLMPTRKRATLLMELLYQNGFVLEAPYEIIRKFVVEKADFIGLDDRTTTQYIGRPRKILAPDENPKTDLIIHYLKTNTKIFKEYSAKRTLPEKLGVCQKLGYMRFEYRGRTPFLVLNHKEVPLPYHLKETALFDSEKSEALERSKDDLCVSPIGSASKNKEADIETIVMERKKREKRL